MTKLMVKLKMNLKNLIYSICFLFRPIIPVLFSLVFLLLASSLLGLTILNLDEKTKTYQVLLAILTGVTASLLIAIMMELYNNYRFNVKRQRELRKFLGLVLRYEIELSAIIKSNDEYEKILGNGRAYAVFSQLNKIIPCLKEMLNDRDYLYQKEIEGIDNILYEYDNLINIIHINLFGVFLDGINDETENKVKLSDQSEEQAITHEPADDSEHCDEATVDCLPLLKFIDKEANRYNKNEKDTFFYDEASEHFKSIIEKAIFMNRTIFANYFEITDMRYESSKKDDGEKYYQNNECEKDTGYEFRSNIISLACGNIDEAMIKLQRRVAKEPYFCVIANYKEKN